MKKFHAIKGFTLLETLASVGILAVVVIGPLSAIVSSSGYARITKDNMTATYLAEEAIELLQNQYDSLYVYCKKNASSTEPGGLCDTNGSATTTGQTSWILFKAKLSNSEGQASGVAQPSCYLPTTGNPYGNNSAGCTFDYNDMLASATQTLTRHYGGDTHCSELIPIATTTARYVTNEGQAGGSSYVISTSTRYVCNGSPLVTTLNKVSAKYFTRIINIEQLSTFESAPADHQYSDDLRVTSNVTFKGQNGVPHSVKIVRFMHARP